MIQRFILLLIICLDLSWQANAQDFVVDYPDTDLQTFLAVPDLKNIYSQKLGSSDTFSVILIDMNADSNKLSGIIDVIVSDSALYTIEWIRTLSGELLKTDTLQSVPNRHQWKLALNFESYDKNLILNVNRLTIAQPEALISVIDRASGQPVYRAELRYHNMLQLTDHDGEVFIDNISENPWIYTLEHSDYFIFTDSLFLSGDTSLVISMTRKVANLKFVIKDTGGVVANQLMSFGGMERYSDINGEVWYFNIPARQVYDYSMQKDGRKPVSDSFYLETDTVLYIYLETVTGFSKYHTLDFQLLPNPAEDHIYITTDAEKAELSVYNMQGKAQYTWNVSRGRTRLDIPSGWSGIYIMEIRTRNEIRHKKMVIRRN